MVSLNSNGHPFLCHKQLNDSAGPIDKWRYQACISGLGEKETKVLLRYFFVAKPASNLVHVEKLTQNFSVLEKVQNFSLKFNLQTCC